MPLLLFLSCALLIITSTAYQPCPIIELDGYSYDLTTMAGNDNIVTVFDSTIIQISPCKLIQCSGGQEKSFVIREGSSFGCKVYTDDVAPLKSHYKMLNVKQPAQGIQISHIPHYQSIETNETFVDDNESNIIISTSETIYETKLQVYCKNSQNSEKKSECTSSTTTNTFTDANEDILTTEKNSMTCKIYSEAGCPQLEMNHFWHFLEDSEIIIAIFVWIVGLFFMILGYVAIRATIFLMGIFTGAFLGTVFTALNYDNFFLENDGIFIYIICISVLMGALFGVFLLTVPKVGYLNIGLWTALIFCLLMQNCVLYLTSSMLAFYIMLGVVGLFMAIISQMEFTWFIVASTSFCGAFWIIRTMGFFLPNYPNEFMSSEKYKLGISTSWEFYLYFVSIIILAILGSIFQFCLLKKLGYSGRNKAYYLEGEGPIKQKIKKIFEFKEIRELLKEGKKEIVQLKNLIGQNDEDEEIDSYFQMKDIDEAHKKSGQGSKNMKGIPPEKTKTRKRKEYSSEDENSP